MFCKRLPVHAAYRPCALKADHSLQFLQNMFIFERLGTNKFIFERLGTKNTFITIPFQSRGGRFTFHPHCLRKMVDCPQLSPVWDCLTFLHCVFSIVKKMVDHPQFEIFPPVVPSLGSLSMPRPLPHQVSLQEEGSPLSHHKCQWCTVSLNFGTLSFAFFLHLKPP